MKVRLRPLRPPPLVAWLSVAAAVFGAGAVVAVALYQDGEPRAAGPDHSPSPPLVTATPTSQATVTPTPTATPIAHTGLLDGVAMTDAEWAARRDLPPIAVMIDNSPEALPQYGLDRADLVYEAFVEGGLTRLMAVYWRRDADVVAPVRSARTPFVIWADELGALYAHAGSAVTANAANAAGQIDQWGVADLEAFAPGPDRAFYRQDDRYAPHNLATGTIALRQAAAALALGHPRSLAPWPFKEDFTGTADAPLVGGLEVDFQENRYAERVIQWHWDRATNSYLRFQGGGPAVDAASKAQLRFKTIVVMRVPWEVVDFAGHVVLEQTGQGQATIFLDGRAVEATWRKPDRAGRTRFFTATGAEVAFNRGPVFLEVVGPASLVISGATVAELPPLPVYERPDPLPPAPEATATARPSATPTPGAKPTASPSPLPSATRTGSPGATASPSASAPASPSASTTALTTASPSPSATALATASPPATTATATR